ncbi:SUKH-4 family immunity protein [Kitasatospora sp. NPDC088346]|uniref:SUKH-4 family immunity protein n=1 Tax=Kitasatospora sp. NPDC088346 TaxID=3364073 RepID=UPI0037FC9C0A
MTTGSEPTPPPGTAFDTAELPALIEDPVFLARVGRVELLAAMAVCWPDGVPVGTLAEDIHHLDRLGVRPAPEQHPQWLSWLHLLLVSHGRALDAEAMAAAAPRLPWRTVWSRWVPPGARAACRASGGNVVGLRAVERDGAPVVLVHEEFVHARPDRAEPDDEEGYHEYAVAPDSGRVLAGPKLYRPYAHDDLPGSYVPLLPGDLPELGGVAVNGPDGWRDAGGGTGPAVGPVLPVCHEQVAHAVLVGQVAVLGGGWGCWAVELDGADTPGAVAAPAWRRPAEQDVATGLAAAEVPRDAREPSRDWLARCFGERSLWSVGPTELPAGLEHAPTRRFLTETGFPIMTSTLLELSSETLASDGLVQLRTEELFGPDDPEAGDRGEFSYVIAKDGERLVALDGRTGEVALFNPERWEGDYHYGAMASSAARLAALLRLYSTYYYGATPAELADAARLLRDWAIELDPATDSSTFWYEVFQDREDFA